MTGFAQLPRKTPGGVTVAATRRRARRRSRFGTQLIEKQNLKGIYGISEEQLRRYYREALKRDVETGQALIALLERRLDNAIFRAGFATTRRQARQMASHCLLVVDGRSVNIPSLSLRVGNFVCVKESKRAKSHFTNFAKRMQHAQPPSWLELDVDHFGFKVIGMPTAEEAAIGADMQAVVELLAR